MTDRVCTRQESFKTLTPFEDSDDDFTTLSQVLCCVLIPGMHLTAFGRGKSGLHCHKFSLTNLKRGVQLHNVPPRVQGPCLSGVQGITGKVYVEYWRGYEEYIKQSTQNVGGGTWDPKSCISRLVILTYPSIRLGCPCLYWAFFLADKLSQTQTYPKTLKNIPKKLNDIPKY